MQKCLLFIENYYTFAKMKETIYYYAISIITINYYNY